MRYLAMIGAMTGVYVIARLLIHLSNYLYEKNKFNFFQNVLAFFTLIFYLLSAPVALILYLIDLKATDRLISNHDKEIEALETRLYKQINEEHSLGYSEGYSEGFADGIAEATSGQRD